jgi:hypothetical protein
MTELDHIFMAIRGVLTQIRQKVTANLRKLPTRRILLVGGSQERGDVADLGRWR